MTPETGPPGTLGEFCPRPVGNSAKARTGKPGMSPYVEALIQRQLERDRLRELIEDAETEHGPVDQAAVEAKRVLLRGDTAGSADAV
ncbi:hypothetical protein [Streptomyces sp. P9-A2]|uniref:hypothetical protein n=1 Tax=Streptomyces sp. P9-A2 TaxID=3072284 RepID=UPI002FC96F52